MPRIPPVLSGGGYPAHMSCARGDSVKIDRQQVELDALGLAVRAVRAGRWLSQEELASRAGLSRNYVGAVERGDASPSYIAVLAIAEALRTTLSELVVYAERIKRGELPV